jgi:hypothetical protein
MKIKTEIIPKLLEVLKSIEQKKNEFPSDEPIEKYISWNFVRANKQTKEVEWDNCVVINQIWFDSWLIKPIKEILEKLRRDKNE